MVGLKCSLNRVVSRCAVIQALLFHLQSTGKVDLALILKGPRVWGMVNEHQFQL